MNDILKYLETDGQDPKRILLISRSFYPVNSPRSLRTTALAKEFARQGHNVTVLTVKDDAVHVPFEIEHGITIKDLGQLRFPTIDISNASGVIGYAKRVLRRALLLFVEYPDIELVSKVSKALQKESDYDLMISVAVPYPIHWGVARARKQNHQIADVWVADCGDPYCGLENDSFSAPFYFSYVEKWFSRKADYITIPFEGARAAYFSEFHSKMKVIPQGLTFPEDIKADEQPTNERITFAYFGNVQSYLHYAVPFLEKLNKRGEDFRFIIYTKDRQLFERVLTQETLQKCEIRDYVERQVLLNQLRHVDFLVHFPYLKGSQKSLKLVDYAYLRKPVLSYKDDNESDRTLNQFMKHNFESAVPLEDYTQYKIENVAARFLELGKSRHQLVTS